MELGYRRVGSALTLPAINRDRADGGLEPLLHGGDVTASAERSPATGKDNGANLVVLRGPVDNLD